MWYCQDLKNTKNNLVGEMLNRTQNGEYRAVFNEGILESATDWRFREQWACALPAPANWKRPLSDRSAAAFNANPARKAIFWKMHTYIMNLPVSNNSGTIKPKYLKELYLMILSLPAEKFGSLKAVNYQLFQIECNKDVKESLSPGRQRNSLFFNVILSAKLVDIGAKRFSGWAAARLWWLAAE